MQIGLAPRGSGEVKALRSTGTQSQPSIRVVEVIVRIQDNFQAQLLMFIINHLVQCVGTCTELLREELQLSQQIHLGLKDKTN